LDLQLFSAGERTEEATPKRRQEARDKGQVFKSTELIGASTLFATYLVLKSFGAFMAGHVLVFAQTLWVQGPQQDWSEAGVRLILLRTMGTAALVAAPVLLTAVIVGVAANVVQVGFLFTLQPIMPQFERMSPIAGLKRMFSVRTLVELGKSLFKVIIISYIGYKTVISDIDKFPALINLEVVQTVTFMTTLVSSLLLWASLSMLVMALADYVFQRYDYAQSLRMSKHDVKEESKQVEGNPEIKRRIRQKQREMARGRMMQDIKKADVVVTNPTHFAVALAYQQGEMSAPKVLAKGQGFVALRIRELAKEYDVPMVENKPLARELHHSVEVGQEVPAELYQTIAEVLAFVYQLKQKGY
jgi:flagellar biosynthesis protein FlhB